MDSSSYHTILAAATDYLVVGPFPAGDTITDLTIVLSGTTDEEHTVAPSVSLTGASSSTDHAAGAALISRSEVQTNGINALRVNALANLPSTVEMKLDRGPLPGPTWIILAITNGDAMVPLNAFVSARSLGPQM